MSISYNQSNVTNWAAHLECSWSGSWSWSSWAVSKTCKIQMDKQVISWFTLIYPIWLWLLLYASGLHSAETRYHQNSDLGSEPASDPSMVSLKFKKRSKILNDMNMNVCEPYILKEVKNQIRSSKQYHCCVPEQTRLLYHYFIASLNHGHYNLIR